MKEEVEKKLREKVIEVATQSKLPFDFDGYNGLPTITMEVSKLKVTKVIIGCYISTYVNSPCYSFSVYLGCDGAYWALNKVESFSKKFNAESELVEYLESESFAEDFYSSQVWKYITDEDYRSYVISEKTKEELEIFERHFYDVIENVGGKEMMRILSPLNQILNYGGDFEAIASFVGKISNIMRENRNLKQQSNGRK